jgi:O-acetyl-ADP-ribose deacetylase (regulator of RNase III)
MMGHEQGSVEAMANARGEVIESPTQDMPFKAVISAGGKVVQERFFASRPAAEGFLAATLAELAKTDSAGEHPATGSATGAVVETPTQDMPFKAVISTEGKILQERFFASRPEAEAFVVETLTELGKSGSDSGRPG